MEKTDFQFLLALIAPLFVWPWVAGWDSSQFKGGWFSASAFVLFTPILEEILFRGFLQGWLLNKEWFKKTNGRASRANHFTSLAFACAHLWQHALLLVPGYFIVSLVLGHFRERSGGILLPVVLHGYYNLGLLIAISQV